MELERKIEKLLRAYARKRRTDAGDPLKLHPAMRRQLQDEVSRHALKPEETEEASLSLWQLFRQQWAFLLGFALMAFLGAMLLLPALSGAKHKAQSFSTMNNLKQIGVAAQMAAENNNGRLPESLDDLSSSLGTKSVLTDSVSGKPFVYIASGKDLKTLSGNAVLAYSPSDKNGRAVLFADGRVELVANGSFTTLTNQESPELALTENVTREEPAKTAVNEPAVAATPLSGGTISQSFAQTAAATESQNLYKNVSASAQAAPVLQSFQVLQNGDAVSVVDRDGSVYQGSVQAVAEAERKEPAPNLPPGGTPVPPEGETTAGQLIATKQQLAAQNYLFRVVGINQTLKRNVVFTGSMETIQGASSNTQSTLGGFGGGGGADRAVQNNQQATTNQQQWQLSNSRIVGTAVIDRTNQIEINAVPVAP
jgi:hypothetical protein